METLTIATPSLGDHSDGDEFTIGGVVIRAVHTPGHTPPYVSYLKAQACA